MKSITQAEIKAALHYSSDTGVFTWLIKPSKNTSIGGVAGYVDRARGYRKITLNGDLYRAHRLAWVYFYGDEFSNCEFIIDHINHNKDDNRIVNLRICSQLDNCRNYPLSKRNKTGFTGVSFRSKKGLYYATIKVLNKSIHLGAFKTIELAIAARKEANVKYGFHEMHGAKS